MVMYFALTAAATVVTGVGESDVYLVSESPNLDQELAARRLPAAGSFRCLIGGESEAGAG